DLVGGEACAVVLAHGFDHVVDQALDFGGPDLPDGDRLRHFAKNGMSEPRDLEDGHRLYLRPNCTIATSLGLESRRAGHPRREGSVRSSPTWIRSGEARTPRGSGARRRRPAPGTRDPGTRT